MVDSTHDYASVRVVLSDSSLWRETANILRMSMNESADKTNSMEVF